MKRTLLLFCFLPAFAAFVSAQNVGIGTNAPDANAILHLESTNKGLLLPNIGSSTRNAMVTPPSGLLLYDFNTKSLWMRGATDWQEIQTFSRSHWTEVNGNLYRLNGRIGIGTSVPLAQLHVKDSTVLFQGQTLLSDPGVLPVPVSGAGTRMMWLPEKSAFRAGTVNSNYWDAANIGAWSFATGADTRATGNYSFAAGMGTHASGIYSVALNANTTASGDNATAMGILTAADGNYSLAGGLSSVAYGGSSFAMGEFARTEGFASVAMGYQPVASGNISVALGTSPVSRAYASVALGAFNDSISTASTNTWVSTDPLLYLGNGNAFNRSNALVVYKNGNTDLNGYTRLGESSNGAPRIKTKKITGFTTPSNANPNSFTFVPHGLNAAKILSISVQVNIVGNFEILPHSPDAGLIYTVNTDPTGGGAGPSIAVGVKSAVQSGSVMGRPIKIFITYEE